MVSVVGESKLHHVLDEIVQHKKEEVARLHQEVSLVSLERQLGAALGVRDFLAALRESPKVPSLIAEVKKASPSRGVIRSDFDPVAIAKGYDQGGASCISVLTDRKFFQGGFENLRAIRWQVTLPLLCKEFVIDAYQIYLARTAGADAVLLIAAILSDSQLQEFLYLIQALGMTALVEVHTLDELDRVVQLDGVRLVGINNRNLENFAVDVKVTQKLLSERRQVLESLDITVVSESGLHTPADLSLVASFGARAVLVGESLVKQNDVEQAVRSLLS